MILRITAMSARQKQKIRSPKSTGVRWRNANVLRTGQFMGQSYAQLCRTLAKVTKTKVHTYISQIGDKIHLSLLDRVR